MEFTGFPEAALDFYDDLELDNSKTFWDAHKQVYDTAVAAPMRALVAQLEPEFGPARVYRPYRDLRFSKDKTPYKTHQGAFVANGPSTGYYVQVGAPGVRVGVGFYDASPARLASIRDAMAEERRGQELLDVMASLEADGWERHGERVKTSPRGWSADHPRIDLLRHKSLSMNKEYGFEPFIHTAELVDRVRADWRAGAPLLDWVLRYSRG
ncbi:DUF2461 domain-containing protein [Aeromicrobium sp. IC_218]|uniref:DUF2461 domain-containing protein n=1 Tax=Aeromicrobium sp. IC_218 TaxID=2545468 RepID=UPI00103B3A35|nr:DUF2461 domain-containing protein [Aeromicrobium sp. IC_218]TCI99539.1 DUF2461 domain-containing protein [Aeromicrobium sp. IC_218]